MIKRLQEMKSKESVNFENRPAYDFRRKSPKEDSYDFGDDDF